MRKWLSVLLCIPFLLCWNSALVEESPGEGEVSAMVNTLQKSNINKHLGSTYLLDAFSGEVYLVDASHQLNSYDIYKMYQAMEAEGWQHIEADNQIFASVAEYSVDVSTLGDECIIMVQSGHGPTLFVFGYAQASTNGNPLFRYAQNHFEDSPRQTITWDEIHATIGHIGQPGGTDTIKGYVTGPSYVYDIGGNLSDPYDSTVNWVLLQFKILYAIRGYDWPIEEIEDWLTVCASPDGTQWIGLDARGNNLVVVMETKDGFGAAVATSTPTITAIPVITPVPTQAPTPVPTAPPGPEWGKWPQTDGGTYEGYVNADGKAEGFGIREYANGDVYYGMFEDGTFSGYGIYLGGDTRDYALMAGTWKDGALHDRWGTVHYKNNDYINGEFSHGQAVDWERSYQKQWGKWHGFVRNLTLQDGSVYTGSYNTYGDGVIFKYGYGVQLCPDGGIYVGEFAYTSISPGGNGIYVSPDRVVRFDQWSATNSPFGTMEADIDRGGGYSISTSAPKEQVWVNCHSCNGNRGRSCSTCGGDGWVELKKVGSDSRGKAIYESVRCSNINCRSGWISCISCGGSGGKWERR